MTIALILLLGFGTLLVPNPHLGNVTHTTHNCCGGNNGRHNEAFN